jgi:putative lipoprotein
MMMSLAGLALAIQATVAAPPASAPPAQAPHQREAWFGPDKLKHFFVAAFVQSVTYSALQVGRVRHDHALAAAWTASAAASVAKELHDRRTTGLFSFRDLVWDAAGAGAATLLIDRAQRRAGREESAQPAADSRSYRASRPLLY